MDHSLFTNGSEKEGRLILFAGAEAPKPEPKTQEKVEATKAEAPKSPADQKGVENAQKDAAAKTEKNVQEQGGRLNGLGDMFNAAGQQVEGIAGRLDGVRGKLTAIERKAQEAREKAFTNQEKRQERQNRELAGKAVDVVEGGQSFIKGVGGKLKEVGQGLKDRAEARRVAAADNAKKTELGAPEKTSVEVRPNAFANVEAGPSATGPTTSESELIRIQNERLAAGQATEKQTEGSPSNVGQNAENNRKAGEVVRNTVANMPPLEGKVRPEDAVRARVEMTLRDHPELQNATIDEHISAYNLKMHIQKSPDGKGVQVAVETEYERKKPEAPQANAKKPEASGPKEPQATAVPMGFPSEDGNTRTATEAGPAAAGPNAKQRETIQKQNKSLTEAQKKEAEAEKKLPANAKKPLEGPAQPKSRAEQAKEKAPTTKGEQLEQGITKAGKDFAEAKNPGEQFAAIMKLLNTLIAYMKAAFDGKLDDKVTGSNDKGAADGKAGEGGGASGAEKAVQGRLDAGGKPKTVEEAREKAKTVKADITKEIGDTKAQAEKDDASIKTLTSDVGTLRHTQAETESKLTELKAQPADRQDKNQIQALEGQVASLKEQVAQKEKDITRIKTERDGRSTRLKELGDQLKALEKHGQSLDSAVKKVEEALQKVQDSLKTQGFTDNIIWKGIMPRLDGTVVIQGANEQLMRYLNNVFPGIQKVEGHDEVVLTPDQLAKLGLPDATAESGKPDSDKATPGKPGDKSADAKADATQESKDSQAKERVNAAKQSIIETLLSKYEPSYADQAKNAGTALVDGALGFGSAGVLRGAGKATLKAATGYSTEGAEANAKKLIAKSVVTTIGSKENGDKELTGTITVKLDEIRSSLSSKATAAIEANFTADGKGGYNYRFTSVQEAENIARHLKASIA